MEEYNNLGKGYYSARVPEKQAPVSVVEDEGPVAEPDMQTLAMVSKTTIQAGMLDFGSVIMQLVPIVTAIEFKIQNGYSTDDDLDIKEIQIISEKHNLSGQYTANLSDWGNKYPACSAKEGTTSNIAGVDFSGNPVYLQKGKVLTFTVFFLPCSDLDDLTFKIIHTDDSWLSTKLAYADKTGILFNRCMKSYVSGIIVPESAKWNVNYSDDFVLTPWETSEKTITPVN